MKADTEKQSQFLSLYVADTHARRDSPMGLSLRACGHRGDDSGRAIGGTLAALGTIDPDIEHGRCRSEWSLESGIGQIRRDSAVE